MTAVALSRAGDRVAAGSADRTVSIWEASSSKIVGKPIALPAAVAAVAFTADGKSIVAGLADGSVRLLDVAGGKQIKTLEGHKGAVHAVVVTPAGDRVLTAGRRWHRPRTTARWRGGGEDRPRQRGSRPRAQPRRRTGRRRRRR
ncbi:MAG: hypothetical protein U0736_25665 [Gemmataceae bacterium]